MWCSRALLKLNWHRHAASIEMLLERDFRHCWWQVCALWHQGCPSDSRDKMQYCSRKESIGISESGGCCHLHSRKRNLTRLHKVFHKKLLLDNLKVKQDQRWLLWDRASYYLSFSQSLLVQSWKWVFGNDWKFHKIQRFFFPGLYGQSVFQFQAKNIDVTSIHSCIHTHSVVYEGLWKFWYHCALKAW